MALSCDKRADPVMSRIKKQELNLILYQTTQDLQNMTKIGCICL